MEKTAPCELLSYEKMKPTPRQTLSLTISSQSSFKYLIKKGLKLKKLIFDVPQDASLIKRYTRYCKSSVHLQTSLKQQKDDKALKKIHHKVQYLKSLQIDGVMKNEKAQKNIKRFIRQSRHLQHYKTSPNVSSERNIQFVFNLKKSTNSINYNRPQRMITALSRSLGPLVSISGNQESIALEIRLSTDPKSSTFSDDILELNRGLKRISFLDNVTIPLEQKNEAHYFLPLFKVKDLKVRTHYDLALITRDECKKLIESFLSRKSAKLLLWPFSYSWPDFMEVLNTSQQMRENNGSCLSFVDFLYDFHSPLEIRQALINHLSITKTVKWENVIFKFKINSLHWFNEERLASLQEIMDALTKEENQSKYKSVVFDLIFVSEFSNDLLMKILTKVSSVILSFLRSASNQKDLKFTLSVDSQGIWDQNIMLFLAHFPDVINSRIFFKLRGVSKEVPNIAQNLRILQGGYSISTIYRDDKPKDLLDQVRDQLETIEKLKMEDDRIKNCFIEMKKSDCFEVLHSEQMNKLDDLMFELVMIETKINEGQIKRWSRENAPQCY